MERDLLGGSSGTAEAVGQYCSAQLLPLGFWQTLVLSGARVTGERSSCPWENKKALK